MAPVFKNGTVSTRCPGCGGEAASFTSNIPGSPTGTGTVIVDAAHKIDGQQFTRILFMLLRCSACGRGGLATVHDNGRVHDGVLEAFYPEWVDTAPLPPGVPEEIVKEFREAELCAAHGAWRSSSAMLRSVLEKTLKLNGYSKGSLKDKIDEAAVDGVITAARKNRAHQEVRVLGNDILHDSWREVLPQEYELAHHYSQRLLEDFYDNRGDVEVILKSKGRIP